MGGVDFTGIYMLCSFNVVSHMLVQSTGGRGVYLLGQNSLLVEF